MIATIMNKHRKKIKIRAESVHGFISITLLFALLGSVMLWQCTERAAYLFRTTVQDERAYVSCMYGAEKGLFVGINRLRNMTVDEVKTNYLGKGSEFNITDEQFDYLKVTYCKVNEVFEVHSLCAANNKNTYVGVKAQLEIYVNPETEKLEIRILKIARL